jgi:phosphopantothenoylcysteine decarboxylase/phosphopantothenate--cysteine ligase
MNQLINKRILLGVTGSIAAYKSADLVRRLRELGAEVRVAMTGAATQFITPLTLQTLSGNPVREALLDPEAEAVMGHIELARWADAVLVAPASADFIARLAQGRANDLLCALCLACEVPVAVAPAMNRVMWANAATQGNCRQLMQRGVRIFGPGQGEQACGEIGPGRMLEPLELVLQLAQLFQTGELSGTSILVTAGPTREELDPVRYISNRSSGKMGYAVAAAAAEAGARVTLVSGPVALATPHSVERIDVETAQQMYEAVMSRVSECDVFVGAAAVADYRPSKRASGKIKKTERAMHLELERTPDILASVAQLSRRPFIVGFAAETERLHEHAMAKLRAKRLDMIAANYVGPGVGFESENNELEVMWEDGGANVPLSSKAKVARNLISIIAERYHAKNPTEDS